MIVRFAPTATLEQRAAVEALLRDLDVRAVPAEAALLLRDSLTVEEIHELACLPGVAGVTSGRRSYATVRVVAMDMPSAVGGQS